MNYENRIQKDRKLILVKMGVIFKEQGKNSEFIYKNTVFQLIRFRDSPRKTDIDDLFISLNIFPIEYRDNIQEIWNFKSILGRKYGIDCDMCYLSDLEPFIQDLIDNKIKY